MTIYKAPGTYTTELQSVNPSTSQGTARRMAIAGKGNDTYTVYNVEVIKGTAGGSDTITDTVSGDVNSVVGVGSIPSLYDYKLTTDYSVSDNTISWAGAANEPTTGSVYYVTYKQVKSTSYYEPVTEDQLDVVRSVFGPESYNGVVNEIALGSKLCFMNGAAEVLCVQQNGTTIQNQEDTIDKLENESLDIVVAPGMCSTTLQQYIFAHVNKMSSDTMKKERIYFTTHYNPEASVDDMVALANSFNNDNVTVIAPPKIDVVLSDAGCMVDITHTVSSAYAGCAIAGIISNPAFDEAEPLTRKQLLGIDSLSGVKYSETEMNKMAANGILVLENINGIIRVRHALTTSLGTINEKELQSKIIRNQTRKDLRATFERFVGTKYSTATNALIAGTLKAFCDEKVRDKVYFEYKDIQVVQSSLDPRTAEVSYSFKAISTVTWIEIKYSLFF